MIFKPVSPLIKTERRREAGRKLGGKGRKEKEKRGSWTKTGR